MKRELLLFTAILSCGAMAQAQPLSTKTNLRFYEHHSPLIAGSMGANGAQSGYDFVNHTYYNSFDASTFGEYKQGEEANIDMVEFRGPYGNPRGNFGFTAGVSDIWGGEIKGNGITKWMPAPNGFNYETITDVKNISMVYNATVAKVDIGAVTEGAVYIARIRNTDEYVAIRTTNVTNASAANYYFDFEYKYGTLSKVSVNDFEEQAALAIYPNPAAEHIVLKNTSQQQLSGKIISTTGQQVSSFNLNAGEAKRMDVQELANGIYFVATTTEDGQQRTDKFIKQ
jgi:hypothetical protein